MLGLVVSLLASPAGALVAPQRASVARASPLRALSIEQVIEKAKVDRLNHLEAQAMEALSISADAGSVVFPNAMIVGDCVITHLLGKLGFLESGKVKIMVVDTFHLFDSTMPFLAELEKTYKFKAEVFQAVGCAAKAEYDAKFGADLWRVDVEQYDKVCKVEPFQRGLKTLKADVMINGRRRDHGKERAYIEMAEVAPIGGGMAKLNPLAYWTLEDCFDYAARYNVPLHPTVAQGYPSQGDAKDTVPVPDPDGLSGVTGAAGSVKWVDGEWVGDKAVWLDYGAERRGRFVGLVNKDGTTKTECGIHVAGAEQTFSRDLWDAGAVTQLSSQEAALDLTKGGKKALVVVYAPWCQFCQKMEADFEETAVQLKAMGIVAAKYRGDEDRGFVEEKFNTKAFPTINLITADGKVVKYDSEDRDVASLLAFVNEDVKV